jgi:hypothetical protein
VLKENEANHDSLLMPAKQRNLYAAPCLVLLFNHVDWKDMFL